MSTLDIGGHAYLVTKTSFDPYYSEFSECLIWGLEIACERGPLGLRPRLSIDCAWTTSAGELSDWTGAVGRIKRWDTRGQTAEAPASLYLYEHTPIEVGELEIVAVGNRFDVRFAGTCDLSYEETLTEQTHISAAVQPTSWGIEVSSTDEVWARRVLGAYISLDDLEAEVTPDGLRFRSRTYGRRTEESA